MGAQDEAGHAARRGVPSATALQEQARALGNPTRHALFARIAAADRPVDVRALTDHVGLNHNAVRQHLAQLVAAGLVVETTAPAVGRGRPRLEYAVDPSADGRWGPTGPYEHLSRLLAAVITTGRSPAEVGRQAAADLGVPVPTGDTVADLVAAMARQGFAPEVRDGRGRTEIVLGHCPYASTATEARDAVCSLHLGIAEGLVAGSDIAVDELVARDPRTAGCRLRLRPTEAADADAGGATGELTLRGRTARATRA